MTECQSTDLQELLPDFLTEQLDREAADAVNRHLSACSACREELALLERVRGVQPLVPAMDTRRMGQALVAMAPGRDVRRIMAPRQSAAPPSVAAPRARPSRTSAATWRMAASLALLLAGGSSVYLIRTGGERGAIDSLRVAQASGQGRSASRLGRMDASLVADARVSISYGDLGDYSASELEQMLTRLEAWDGNTSPEPLPTTSIVSTQGGREP